MYKVVVLQPGYSIVEEDGSMRANGTSTLVVSIVPCVDYHKILVKDDHHCQIGEGLVVLVDTLSPWDRELLLAALAREGFAPGDVTHLVRFCSFLALDLLLCDRFVHMAILTMLATTTCSPQQRWHRLRAKTKI